MRSLQGDRKGQDDRKGRSLEDYVAPTIRRSGLPSSCIVGTGLAPALRPVTVPSPCLVQLLLNIACRDSRHPCRDSRHLCPRRLDGAPGSGNGYRLRMIGLAVHALR